VTETLQDPPAETTDQLQPVGRRIDQHELLDRQHVTQPAEPVDQLGGVRRPAADDCDLHRADLIL
jgi:hypothetical protein